MELGLQSWRLAAGAGGLGGGLSVEMWGAGAVRKQPPSLAGPITHRPALTSWGSWRRLRPWAGQGGSRGSMGPPAPPFGWVLGVSPQESSQQHLVLVREWALHP